MKKTLTINISGIVFHIEEDAFEKLQNYLQLLNNFFECQTGGKEILQDIESRIAELLQEKITEGKEAVTGMLVEEVINRMGNPEDFMDQEEMEAAGNICSTEKTEKTEKTKKRMYRDGENRVLGGVCSGMGAYFNFDPVFIRILFVLLALIGVGISAIIYLVLWIVVPEARTTTQRLEMKGEEPTISNIQKTIQEEVKEVQNSFSKINQSESVRKGKKIAQKAGQVSVELVRRLGRVAGIAFGSLLMLVGFIGLIIFLISVIIGDSFLPIQAASINPEVDFSGMLGVMMNPGLVGVSILLIVLLIGIPLLVILFLGTKLVFRYKTNNKLIGLGAFGIWLVALISLIALTAGQFSNFSEHNSTSSGKPIDCPTCKTLYLELGNTSGMVVENNNLQINDFILIAAGPEKILAGKPQLRIEASDAKDFSVIIKKSARGKNSEDVQKNLEKIQYKTSSKDSILILDPYFFLKNQSRWRNQEVQVTLKVPEGKMIHLGDHLDQLKFDFDNINNIWNKEMTGKTWKMTPEGLALKE